LPGEPSGLWSPGRQSGTIRSAHLEQARRPLDRLGKDTAMTDEPKSESLDPSGNLGPTEHGPPNPDDAEISKRMITSAVWGGFPARVNSEHGENVKAWNPSCSWYQYGKNYGLDGCQHPGMDIGISSGTDLFAAAGGRVVFAGHDGVYVPNHVNILTDDGEVHIYGHMSSVSSNIRADRRVETGQFLGKSGNSNGDHLHFERRVPGNCRSGFCAVEVDSVLVEGGRPPVAFAARDRIRVFDPPLRLRAAAGLDADIVEELGLDTELCVTGGPQQADGFDWYEVTKREGNGRGWLAGRFCTLVEAQGC
jgi:murein DD-endopeptidase MepM/ murein hydrolase activator NlpD